MKKIILLFGFMLLFTGCIDKPEIKIKDIRVEGMSKGEVRLKVLLDIFNSNKMDINLRKIDFLMSYDNRTFGNGSWEGDEVIGAESNKVLPVSVVGDQDMIAKALFAYFGEGSPEARARLSLDGRAIINKFGLTYYKEFKWKYKEKKKEPKDPKKDGREPKKETRELKQDVKEQKKDLNSQKKETKEQKQQN